jgi:hypothetical protein
MSPRELIGFLVSCIRSGERLSPQDDEVVAGVLAGLASAPEQQAKIEALAEALTEAREHLAALRHVQIASQQKNDSAATLGTLNTIDAALRLAGRP